MKIKTLDDSIPVAPPTLTRGSLRATAILRDRIESGFYSTGEYLPTERALSDDLRVHRRVIRAAIDELIREGMISQKPHCRPVVGQPGDDTHSAGGVATRASSTLPSSSLVALIMWHGAGGLERAGTAQARIFWSVNDQLSAAGYHALFLDLSRRPEEEEIEDREAAYLNYALDHGFGGIIFYPYTYRKNRELVKRVSERIPVVLLDRTVGDDEANFVGVNNYQAMFDMTTHLLNQGHQRIAYITENDPIHPVQERLRGYIEAVRGAGALELVVTTPLGGEKHDPWPIFEAVFRLPKDARPTAAVCVNDYSAVHVTARLQSLGLSVPADVAVSGFDDIIHALPDGLGLTTIAQPFEEIGERAAELLLSRLKNPFAPSEFIEMPAHLKIRASTPSLSPNTD